MLEAQKYVEHPLIWPGKVEFRLYQKRIADVASERNTLVILPTALGKTVISALVAANILYMKLLEKGAEGLTVEQLMLDPELEWASPNVLKAALGMMVNEELIVEVEAGRYAVASAGDSKRLEEPWSRVFRCTPRCAHLLPGNGYRRLRNLRSEACKVV